MLETCATCKYYLSQGNPPLCRANPPQVIAIPIPNSNEFQVQSHFPPMQPTGWCGRYALKGFMN